jgi:O-antigen ligase
MRAYLKSLHAPDYEPYANHETAIVAHVASTIALAGWCFGGQAPWVRELLTIWSLAGGGLCLGLIMHARKLARRRPFAPWWQATWPLHAYTALVLAGLLNPSFERVMMWGDPVLLETAPSSWWPSTARPDLVPADLGLFLGLVLTASNVWFGIERRGALRLLAVLLAANAVILAIYGSFDRLLGNTLIYGLVASPNPFRFGPFIYHNHWAAFALLGLSLTLGLLFHALHRHAGAAWLRSPAWAAGVAALVLAATLPLAASRSGTALALVLAVAAVAQGLRQRHHGGTRRRWQVIGTLTAAALAVVAVGALARPVFAPRLEQSREQIHALRHGDLVAVDDRPALYRDTLRMFSERPFFGWGLESYGSVFPAYRGRDIVGARYEHAHSDWLQSFAESGLVGTALLIGFVARLACRIRWRDLPVVSAWTLGGAALVLLYAAVEFPFANPAVQAMWWTVLFLGLRYARLEQSARAPKQAESAAP